MKPEHDDHLPPPPGAGGQSESRPRPAAPAARPYAWGDRVLFAACGALLGFAAAWGYLEKARPAAPAAVADPHDHAQEGGGAPMSQDPAVKQRVREIEAALDAAPDDRALLVRLGNAAFDADEHRLAVRAYERALALKGDDANVLTDVGVSYRSLGDLDKALASFEKALQVEPDHWQAVFNQVIVYGIDRGDRKKGLELLDRLKKLKGKFPEIPPLDQLEATLGAGG